MNFRVHLLILLGVLSLGCSKPEQAQDASALPEQGTEAEKATYVQKTKQEVDQWSAKVKAIEDKSKASGTKVRQEVDVYVQKARENISDVKHGLKELSGSAESSWEPIKRGLDEAMANLRANIARATASFDRSAKSATTPKEKS